jgi:hypothetical protein
LGKSGEQYIVCRDAAGERFERADVQWMFVSLSIVLVVIAAGEAVALRRSRSQIESLRAAELNAQVERDRLRTEVSREQAARESFSLELARERGAGSPVTLPTLTLSPLTKRGAQPPDPTVVKPADNQTIQLRLVLPATAKLPASRYTIVLRTWTEGETIWSRGGLSISTVENMRMVTTLISGDVLSAGAYEIALTSNAADKAADVAAYEVGVRPADR